MTIHGVPSDAREAGPMAGRNGRPPLDADAGSERVTLRLPTPLRAAVAAEAERRGTTFSDAARQALAGWLDAEATEAVPA